MPYKLAIQSVLYNGYKKRPYINMQYACVCLSAWKVSLGGYCLLVKSMFSSFFYDNQVDVGEWLYFRNMGAYTCSAASTFNGFNKPMKYYTIGHRCW